MLLGLVQCRLSPSTFLLALFPHTLPLQDLAPRNALTAADLETSRGTALVFRCVLMYNRLLGLTQLGAPPGLLPVVSLAGMKPRRHRGCMLC